MPESLVQITDKKGRLIGSAGMLDAFDQGLVRHTAYCLLSDPEGRLLLQRRSDSSPNYPGHWEMSAGGHIDEGETPEQAARRELSEELGINDVKLSRKTEFYYESEGDGRTYRYYAHIFMGSYDCIEKLHPEASEVSEVRFFLSSEVSGLNKVTPITRHVLEAL